MKFKVMSFNLRYNNALDRKNGWWFRKEKVAKIIIDNDPLIVGTQEGLFFMLTDLDQLLDDYQYTGEGREGGNIGEYSAIFYKKDELEIIENGQFWLSKTPKNPGSKSWWSSLPRICTWVHFRSVTDIANEFICYNTHLDHWSRKAREQGILLIWKKMQNAFKQKGLPMILMGDLNSKTNTEVVRFLRGNTKIGGFSAELKDTYSILENIGATFHYFSGKIQGEPIDYIFVTSDLKIMDTKIDRRKIDGVYPSDHYPVIGELSL